MDEQPVQPPLEKADIEAAINKEFEDAQTRVYTFDPNDPPEKKAKQATEGDGSNVPAKPVVIKEVISDIGDKTEEDKATSLMPGTLAPVSTESASDIPEWARIGWEQVAELDATNPEHDFYEHLLGELYFGHLWLNAGVVFVAVFATWIITSLGGGLGWVIIICGFVATYFKNSVNRFYRNARSDISRELAKEKLALETGEESAEWLNEFLRRFWLIYEPVLSKTIVQIADGILVASTPHFLDSIRLTTFTLGTKPPIIDSVRSYPKTEDDVVVMDWEFSFSPNDLANMSKVQLSKKVNPKIILTVRVGRGMVGAGIPILLENMSFSGLMRVKLKLINTFPHIKTVEMCFLEEPKIDYVLKPIGGETFGFDIANIPGLQPFIRDQIHATLRPMMYEPNVYPLDIEYLLGGYPIDSAIGVLAVTIYGAKGLKNSEMFGTSDPYCKLTMRGGQVLAKTKVINDTLTPVWNETFYLVINSLSETLNFDVYDCNEMTKDRLMGTASFPLSSLAENQKQEEVSAPVLLNSKPFGEVKFDMNWCPVAEATETEPAPESDIGILRFTVHQAKDLDPKRSMVGQYNPYAEIFMNGKIVQTTKVIKRNNNPVWEEPVELFVTDKPGAEISVKVRDSRDLAADPIVASWTGKLSEFLSSKNDWFNVQDAAGKLRMSCIWKPVLIEGGLNLNAGAYVEPIGVVRLHIKKAIGVKSSGQLRGKSDPYVVVKLNNVLRGRTEMIPDTLNPEWKNEVFYIPVHTARELINLTVWDYENAAKDKLLGSTEFKISQLFKQNEDNTYSPTETLDTSAPLNINRETRGELVFTASFHPTIQPPKVASEEVIPKESEGDSEAQKAAEVPKVVEIPKVIVDDADYQSGVLIVNLKGATMEKRGASVECFADNALFPSFTSIQCKTQNPEWNQVLDIFVKELDWAKVTFSIKQFNDKNPVGSVVQDVNDLIEKCKESPEGVSLKIDGISDGILRLSVRYVPVDYTLDPSERVDNMGTLNVKVKNAENLPAADRGGTSDPYIQFLLNDEKIFKTKTVKKDLNPVFDEEFTATVHSRSGDKFILEVYDWNQLGSSKRIAHGQLNLADLPVIEAVEKKVPLTNSEDGSKTGSVSLRLRFEPQLVYKKRLPTGTFAGATKTITGIGTGVISGGGSALKGGVGIVGSGVNLVGSGASSVAGAVGSGFGILKKDKKKVEEENEKVEPVTRNINPGAAETKAQEKSQNVENNDVRSSTYSTGESNESMGESGNLKLTIIEAKDLIAADSGGTSDPYVKVKLNKKEIHKTQVMKKTLNPRWDEVAQIPNLSGSIYLAVKDHNVMGKDVDIGEYELNLWDHIQPTASNYTKDVWVDLSKGGNGKLHLKLEYIPKGSNGDLPNSRFSGDSDRDSDGSRFRSFRNKFKS